MFVPKLFGPRWTARPAATADVGLPPRCDVARRWRGQRRRPELDLLRITACLIQFPFHTGMVFSHDPLYHIKNP